ncbi:metallophosphoesterase [Nesterenkonia rhizosphaerae]|uniref:Calcineurin-like phosphoesterase domain-containing protein n=1 Tax=Nesterenkonia rhizosphaerae TaxID=1348272 RepID=A0ABP9G1A3_9MICC
MGRAEKLLQTLSFKDDVHQVEEEKASLLAKFDASWDGETERIDVLIRVKSHIDYETPSVLPGKKSVATIALAGDWHSNTHVAAARFLQARDAGADVLVHVGDLGVWPGPAGARFLAALEFFAKETGIPLYFIDGNHEDFDQLDSAMRECGEHAEVGVLRPWVYHLRRGSVWHWGTTGFAALGGAPSIDRLQRVPGRSWWAGERITQGDIDRLERNTESHMQTHGDVDVLLTHDAPARAPLPSRRFPLPSIIEWEAGQGRRMISQAVRITTPGLIVHGHYHESRRYQLGPGINGLCMNMEDQPGALAVIHLSS